ncbi:GGDEF domain-containing protein [Actinoalloteichus sp. GBA129-24]|uniref:GGDEF domain-containing protein n=1 Tax=Actinoalloteichus sp. GBA129-24 TaxID=1612551 RepID=UPI0009503DFD|nr:GGDEF domain-containing protein [Actinoalloteichus sp. GBA129-24]APU18607.1 diguanylate cyclase (GGDEF) domain-containing protein [Actinoalloteichus sp. GBA129-24]
MFAETMAVVASAGWAVSTIASARLARRARTDDLTGLSNRSALEFAARRALPRSGLVGCLLLDLDRFKTINDTHGHRFGDLVLCTVAARLRIATRRPELAVRLHGDEFAVWLGKVSSTSDAARRARDLSDVIAEPMTLDGHRLVVTASVGAATETTAHATLGGLLDRADHGMYVDKHRDRPTVLVTDTPPTELRLRDVRREAA